MSEFWGVWNLEVALLRDSQEETAARISARAAMG